MFSDSQILTVVPSLLLHSYQLSQLAAAISPPTSPRARPRLHPHFKDHRPSPQHIPDSIITETQRTPNSDQHWRATLLLMVPQLPQCFLVPLRLLLLVHLLLLLLRGTPISLLEGQMKIVPWCPTTLQTPMVPPPLPLQTDPGLPTTHHPQ